MSHARIGRRSVSQVGDPPRFQRHAGAPWVAAARVRDGAFQVCADELLPPIHAEIVVSPVEFRLSSWWCRVALTRRPPRSCLCLGRQGPAVVCDAAGRRPEDDTLRATGRQARIRFSRSTRLPHSRRPARRLSSLTGVTIRSPWTIGAPQTSHSGRPALNAAGLPLSKATCPSAGVSACCSVKPQAPDEAAGIDRHGLGHARITGTPPAPNRLGRGAQYALQIIFLDRYVGMSSGPSRSLTRSMRGPKPFWTRSWSGSPSWNGRVRGSAGPTRTRSPGRGTRT